MSKWQKIGLGLLATLVTLIVCFHAWRSCTHESEVQVSAQDQIDSLQVLKDRAKANAESGKDTSQIFHQKYEVGNKNYNSPIDSSERENVWTKYWNAIAADTNRKHSPR